MKYVVCFSGGHSSAIAAIEIARKYGKENVILLNHDISSLVEHEDIKRFKLDISRYLDIPITHANRFDFEKLTPINMALYIGGFQFGAGKAICTYYLKTKPFYDYLDMYCHDKENYTIVYGFDAEEEERIHRRKTTLRSMGYKTEFPLAQNDRTILNTEEIGIERPITYKLYKHANCIGCLKAGRQHWYCVYCLRPDIWQEAKQAEEKLGHSIIKGVFLKELEPIFYEMKELKKICPNDKINAQTFWAKVNNTLPEQETFLPCDCSF